MLNKARNYFLWLFFLSAPLQLGKHFWPDWSYVWGVKVDYLSPVIYLNDIFFLGCLGLFLPEIILRINFKKNWKIILFVLIFAFLNCFFSLNIWVAVLKWARLLLISGLVLFVSQNKKIIENILAKVIPLWVIILFGIVLAQVFLQSNIGGLFWWLGERTFDVNTPGIAKTFIFGRFYLRPYGIFSHPNSLAGFVLVSAIIFYNLKQNSAILKKIVLVFTGLIVGLSLSRSAIFVGVSFLTWSFFKKKKWHLLLLAFLPIGLVFLNSNLDLSILRRVDLAFSATKMFATSPLIGVGLNNFIVNLPAFWSGGLWLQPVHNIFLLVLAEGGVVGLIILLKVFQKISKSCYFPAFVAIVLTGLFDHYWLTLAQNIILFGLVIGLSIKNEN